MKATKMQASGYLLRSVAIFASTAIATYFTVRQMRQEAQNTNFQNPSGRFFN